MTQQDQHDRAFVKSIDSSIRGVLGTPGLAVALLVAACIAVEVGILIATQQYEAATAPKGVTLIFGMSSAGMVVFLAEMLKLPIAWVSGVVTGYNRLIFNLITVGLCLLTAYTIKDLTTREWNMALEPARELQRSADEKLSEIAGLEKKKADLAQDTNNASAYWREQIAQTNSELEAIQSRKVVEQREHTERLRALVVQADPGGAERIRSAEQIRETKVAAIDKDVEALERQLTEERTAARSSSESDSSDFDKAVARAIEERKAVEARNIRAEQAAATNYESDIRRYNSELATYEVSRKEYEAARAAVIKTRDQRIKDLEKQDAAFFNLSAKKAEVSTEASKELARIEADFKARPAPAQPERRQARLEPLPEVPTRDGKSNSTADSPRIAEIRRSIVALQQERSKVLAESAGEITAIVDRIAANAAVATAATAEQRKLLEDNFNNLVRGFDAQISALVERRTKEEGERARIARSPAEIQRESDEITAELPKLRKEAERLRNLAEKERIDTNPVRSASGVIRWLMPNASPEEHEAAAFGIFPLLIGILVATLPAFLLELGVHALRPNSERTPRGFIKMLLSPKRHREALRLHQSRVSAQEARCADLLQRLELDRAALEEMALQRKSEHERLVTEQRSKYDQLVLAEVEKRIAVFDQERSVMAASIASVTQEHSHISEQLRGMISELNKHREDNVRLMNHVHVLDLTLKRSGSSTPQGG
jgi:hypothetical protein